MRENKRRPWSGKPVPGPSLVEETVPQPFPRPDDPPPQPQQQAIGGLRVLRLFRGWLRLFRGRLRLFRSRLRLFRGRLGLFRGRLRLFRGRLGLFRGRLGLFRSRLGLFRSRLRLFRRQVVQSRLTDQCGVIQIGHIQVDGPLHAGNAARTAVLPDPHPAAPPIGEPGGVIRHPVVEILQLVVIEILVKPIAGAVEE